MLKQTKKNIKHLEARTIRKVNAANPNVANAVKGIWFQKRRKPVSTGDGKGYSARAGQHNASVEVPLPPVHPRSGHCRSPLISAEAGFGKQPRM